MRLDATHVAALDNILTWRRDVRHFRTDPIKSDTLREIEGAVELAPSVGNARPWRFVRVESADLRKQIIENFQIANREASGIYENEKRNEYMKLKLAGLVEAPTHLAVFTDLEPTAGHGLGRQTMPEMLTFSTVMAIHTLWLAARVRNVGVGWVSIIDPDPLTALLDVPANWHLTGYLCLGYPTEFHDTPELDRRKWQSNTPTVWMER